MSDGAPSNAANMSTTINVSFIQHIFITSRVPQVTLYLANRPWRCVKSGVTTFICSP